MVVRHKALSKINGSKEASSIHSTASCSIISSRAKSETRELVHEAQVARRAYSSRLRAKPRACFMCLQI